MRPRTKSSNEQSKRHIRKERHRQPDVRRTEKKQCQSDYSTKTERPKNRRERKSFR